jgi:hypothetical protein
MKFVGSKYGTKIILMSLYLELNTCVTIGTDLDGIETGVFELILSPEC